MGGNLLITKLYFVFARFKILNSDINLKLNNGSDKLKKGSNCYPHRVTGNADVKELMAGVMRCEVKFKHHSGRIIIVKGDVSCVCVPMIPMF